MIPNKPAHTQVQEQLEVSAEDANFLLAAVHLGLKPTRAARFMRCSEEVAATRLQATQDILGGLR